MPPSDRGMERLMTIPEVAAEAKMAPYTMRRRLMWFHRQYGGDWLIRVGKRAYAINLSMLRAAHPELFSKKTALRADVDTLREDLRSLRKDHNGLAARHRETRRKLDEHLLLR